MAFFIQGVSFRQCNEPVSSEQVKPFMFSGIIWKDEQTGQMTGFMRDLNGRSVLSQIEIDKEKMIFTMEYTTQGHTVTLTFKRRRGNQWFGEFQGQFVGHGFTTCLLLNMKPEFFDPNLIKKILEEPVQQKQPQPVEARLLKEREVYIHSVGYTGRMCPPHYDYCSQCGHVARASVFKKKDKCPNPTCPHPTLWND